MKEVADYIEKEIALQTAIRLHLENECQDAELKNSMMAAYRALQTSVKTLVDTPFSYDRDSAFQTLRRIKNFRRRIAINNFAMETSDRKLRKLPESERSAKSREIEDTRLATDTLKAERCFKSLAIEHLSYDQDVRVWLRENEPDLLERLDQYVESQKPKLAWEGLTKDQKADYIGTHFLRDSVPLSYKIMRVVAPRLMCHFVRAVNDATENIALARLKQILEQKKPSVPMPM